MERALRYNVNKPKWGLVHYKSLLPMIRVLEYGAHKYSIFEDSLGNQYRGDQVSPQDVKTMNLVLVSSGKDNWKLPMDLREILESMQRHIADILDGEVLDKESGISHIGHIQCNCLFYNYHSLLNENKST